MRKRMQSFLICIAVFTLVILALFSSPQKAQVTQVTSTQELGDIRPSDVEYQALQSIIERYGIDVSFPDRTFRGKQPLTRSDFVIYLNEALQRVEEVIAAGTADQPDVMQLNHDLEFVSNQVDSSNRAISTRISNIKTRLSNLEKVTNSKGLGEKNSSSKQFDRVIAKLPVPPRSAVKDISPADAYYNALKNILERYEINVLFPNLTFQGKQPIKRGDFAIYLDEALSYLSELMTATDLRQAVDQKYQQLQTRLNSTRRSYQKDMEEIKQRLNTLEKRFNR